MIQGIILAAGKGSRMKTALPKCAYPILGKPMISYSVDTLKKSGINDMIVVVGHKHSAIKDVLGNSVRFAYQEKQLGTADAVKAAINLIEHNKVCVIMLGDCPLIEAEHIQKMLLKHMTTNSALTVATTIIDNPKGYGRIIRDMDDCIMDIVEEKELIGTQHVLKEINCGLYCINTNVLKEVISKIENNNESNEFYFTDIVKILYGKVKISTENFCDFSPFIGVNDLYNLSIVENIISDKIKKNFMIDGIRIIQPNTVLIEETVEIKKGAVIMPNTIIRGKSIIGQNSIVGPNSEVIDSVLGDEVTCKHSVVSNSKVGSFTTIGPFSNIRDNCIIGDKNRIGNFVELKKTTTGEQTKMSHLAYLGDCECGSNVNFGCGCITVNYDGKKKYRTVIGDNVFVGCNSNLIAPITLENNSLIAAGTTLYKDVPIDNLAIGRVEQINKKR